MATSRVKSSYESAKTGGLSRLPGRDAQDQPGIQPGPPGGMDGGDPGPPRHLEQLHPGVAEQPGADDGPGRQQVRGNGRPGRGLGRAFGPELAEEPDGRLRGGGAVGRQLPPDVGAGGGGLGDRPWEAGGAARQAGHRFWAGDWVSAAGFTRGGSWKPTRGW